MIKHKNLKAGEKPAFILLHNRTRAISNLFFSGKCGILEKQKKKEAVT